MRAVRRLTVTEAWITSGLVAEMHNEADSKLPLESGGLLMGYWADRDSVVITDLIEPGPRTRHETRSFAPDYDFQERRAAEICRYRRCGHISRRLALASRRRNRAQSEGPKTPGFDGSPP